MRVFRERPQKTAEAMSEMARTETEMQTFGQ